MNRSEFVGEWTLHVTVLYFSILHLRIFDRTGCCVYSFGYSLFDDGLLEAETCRKDVINYDYLLLIMQFVGLDAVLRSTHTYLLIAVSRTYRTRKMTLNVSVWHSPASKGWYDVVWVKTCLTLILRRSRTGTVWFYTSTSNKRAARPKLYTESLTRDLKRMYSRLTLVRISINL